MPHSNYDYVLLLPLLILSISNFNLSINKFDNDTTNLKAIKLSFFITGCVIYLIYKLI